MNLVFDKSNSMLVISHNPKCDDEFRNSSFLNTKSIMSLDTKFVEIPSLYPNSFKELEDYISQLPSDYLNLLPNSDCRETLRVITRERTEKVLLLWRKVYEFAFDHSADLELPVKETRRFALHLHLWMALEAFLLSDLTFMFYFEDDVEVRPDFVRAASQLFFSIPDDFDVFNFALDPGQIQYFNSALQIGNSPVSRNYHCATGAAIVLSRKGARKILYRMLFEVESMLRDMNLSKNFDMVFSNTNYNLGHIRNSHYIEFTSAGSSFQTYTIIPAFRELATVRFGHSLWQNL